MSLWSWIVTPTLIALPALVLACTRPTRPALARRLRRALFLATGAALLLFAALAWLRSAGRFAWWDELPKFTTWGKEPAEITWVACFPLWVLASRALAAGNPERAGPRDRTRATRSAALVSRRGSTSVPRSVWLLPVIPWAVAVAIAAASWAALDRGQRLFALVALATLVPGLVLGPWIVAPALEREPEPLPEGGSDELVAAYARHRRRRTIGLFVLQLALTTLGAAAVVAVVLARLDEATLAIAGAVAGSAIGVAGAVFGVWMSTERTRLRRRLDELENAAGT